MTSAVFARQTTAFRVVGRFLMRAVWKIDASQPSHVVVGEFRSSTQLINRGTLLADGVVFNLGEGTVRKSGLQQPIQLVVFVAGGYRFQLGQQVRALNGLAGAIAIRVITESGFVPERICLPGQVATGVVVTREVAERVSHRGTLAVKHAVTKAGRVIQRIRSRQ